MDALLARDRGLSGKAGVNVTGVTAALELRANLGYLAAPIPPVEKYVDLSYYRKASAIGE